MPGTNPIKNYTPESVSHMQIKYSFSSPDGEIPVGKTERDLPFKISPWEEHPFLTVGEYFDVLSRIITRNEGDQGLLYAINEKMGTNLKRDEISEILIRSEKHGALYHIASLHVFSKRGPFTFSMSSALSENGRDLLFKEFEILTSLEGLFHLPYLPRPFMFDEMEYQAPEGRSLLAVLLAEWFEDFHEWHLSVGKDMRPRVCIWDVNWGHRFATEREAFEIIKQASKILTLYYNVHTFEQIYPWHHAAGDFIVGSRRGTILVKLTTARGYRPLPLFLAEEDVDPITAVVYFFLDMCIKMRLDKLDGVGSPLLAGDFFVKAATDGFMEAIRTKEEMGSFGIIPLDELLSLLRSFTPKELLKLYDLLIVMYSEEDAADFRIIKSGLEGHISLVHKALQEYPS